MKKTFAFFLSFLFLAGCLCGKNHEELFRSGNEKLKEEAVKADIAAKPDEKQTEYVSGNEENKAVKAHERDLSFAGNVSSQDALYGENISKTASPIASDAEIEEENAVTNFAFDSSALTQKSKDSIAAYAQSIKDENYNITVFGHTDSVGTNAYNQKLSERRAKAVKDELVNNGIEVEKIRIIGYGEDRPVADNATAAGRAKNRRAVIFAELY